MKKNIRICDTLDEQPEELHYWKNKTVEERFEASHELHRQFWPDEIDKPMDKSTWKIGNLHDPGIVYNSSEDDVSRS